MKMIVYISIFFYFVFCCDQTLRVYTIDVLIDGNKEGLIGENGTKIQCSYPLGNYNQFFVSFWAMEKNSKQYEQIATYVPGSTPIINTKGAYLKGRVTLTPLTHISTQANMTFTKLMCIDDKFYRCQMSYIDSTGNHYNISNKISISVLVPPSKPDSISIIHTPAPKHMEDSTSSPQSTMASEENDIVLTAQGITEGGYITVVCTGDVGKPLAEHVFQKYLNGQIVPMQDSVITASISKISDNCSYYRTSNLTFQVTAQDNNVVVRCVVNSPMADPDMYVETALIEVYYEVSEPTITKYPNKPYYVVGENTSILLTCKSDGNPKPDYQWYKENDNMLISTNERLTITDMNVTNSGIYTCNVSNSFDGDTHRNAKHVQIDIINKANIAPSTTFRTSFSNKTLVIKQSNNENTAVIVVGTVCGSIILVLCVILFGVLQNKNKTFRCLLRRNRPDRSLDYVNTIQEQDLSLYEGVGQALDVHNYEQLSRMEHVYNNTNLSNN